VRISSSGQRRHFARELGEAQLGSEHGVEIVAIGGQPALCRRPSLR